ncbi:MAG: methyltransferase domain-containing protein [Candidatus Glassbacteria bacterium]|nr:methyltransferase domain-containing protein [Candidatus Glassbacteria bacterium]
MILTEEKLRGVKPYWDRLERAGFIVEQFGWAIEEPLLDVGCGEKHLKQALPGGFSYTGLDLSACADVRCNLDGGQIPFKENSFATVVCADVLEHLENIHRVFIDLFRITSRHLIVSLPNCWCDLKYLMALGGRGSGKFYGLPAVRPQDRHRWFFNYSEARRFLIENSRTTTRSARLYRYYGPQGRTFRLGRILLPGSRFDDLFVNTLWAVFEK